MTTRAISLSAGAISGSESPVPISPTRLTTIAVSSSMSLGSGSTTTLKRRFSAEDSSFTPLSRLLAVAMTLKPRRACTASFSSGIGRIFSESTVISVSCTSEPMRVSSSSRSRRAVLHGAEERRRHQRLARRPLGEQQRIVPAVADLRLVGAGRALDELLRIAGDGGRQVLRHPGLRGSRHAEQQERAIGRKRRDRRLHQPAVADILWRDLFAAFQPAAHQIGDHGLRRHLPARTAAAGRPISPARRAQRRRSPRRAAGACSRRSIESWRPWRSSVRIWQGEKEAVEVRGAGANAPIVIDEFVRKARGG